MKIACYVSFATMFISTPRITLPTLYAESSRLHNLHTLNPAILSVNPATTSPEVHGCDTLVMAPSSISREMR